VTTQNLFIKINKIIFDMEVWPFGLWEFA